LASKLHYSVAEVFMKRFHAVATVLGCAFLFAALSPAIRASEWDKKTYITFSNAVEVPGATLEAGKYVFKLLDSASDRHIVQIKNERENHVYATILAINNYRLTPPDKTVITFYEMPSGQPPAVRAWFYPGDNFGQEFAYPKSRAAEIASATNQNVPVTAAVGPAVTAETPTQSSETETTVSPEETQMPDDGSSKAVAPEPTPALDDSQPEESPAEPAEPVAEPAPAAPTPDNSDTAEMPETASPMPLIGLIGMLSLFSAIGLRTLARRLN
jgi:hypothetical protein